MTHCPPLLFVFFLLLATSTHAQIQTEPITISEDVSDSVISERAGDWPTTQVSGEDLKPTSRPLSETLNTVPGIQSREQGSPTISIRGSAQADRVLKLYEGVPLNFADGLGASNFFIPEEAIGSLRILKGPGSVFFGPSAMAGAIDHRTRNFETVFLRTSLADDTGLLGRRSLFFATPIKKSQLTLFAERAPQLYRYNTPSGATRRENNGLNTLRATFRSDWLQGQTRVRPLLVVAKQAGDLSGSIDSPYLSSFETKGTLAAIETLTPLANNHDLSFRISDLRLWRDDQESSGSAFWENGRSMVSADWRASFAAGTLRTFVDMKTDHLNATSLEAKTESTLEIGQTFESPLGLHGSVQPGYRYLPKYGEFVKILGVRYALAQLQTWMQYSEGFRNASLSDRFAKFATFVPNEGLQPERTRGGELGFRFEERRSLRGLPEGLTLGAVTHFTHYDNLFETANVSSTTTTKVNVGRAKTRGVELDVGYIEQNWSALLAHSYLDARNEVTGERLRLAPQNQTALTVSTAAGPVILEMKETLWSSTIDRDVSNNVRELPAWSTLDFNIRTRGPLDWEFRAGIFNLFDHPIMLTSGYPEPQRRFYLSAGRFL